jgi:hypothetical protein
MYATAALELAKAGMEPPRYPPCTRLPPARLRPSNRLKGIQQRTYGLPFAGLAVYLLAAAEGEPGADYLSIVDVEDSGKALAEAWGVAWRSVA